MVAYYFTRSSILLKVEQATLISNSISSNNKKDQFTLYSR